MVSGSVQGELIQKGNKVGESWHGRCSIQSTMTTGNTILEEQKYEVTESIECWELPKKLVVELEGWSDKARFLVSTSPLVKECSEKLV